jgi:flagellar hook-length control protein FliK
MRAGGEHVMQNVPWAPQFTDEVGEQVRVFVSNGLQEARLQLTPAELGRVQITINTEGDNARVVFVAETAVARDLLDQSMPRLREMLQQSGIQLAHGDVSDQTESQRRGEPLDEDAQRMAQGDSDAQADDQALRPELANVDAEEALGGPVGSIPTSKRAL